MFLSLEMNSFEELKSSSVNFWTAIKALKHCCTLDIYFIDNLSTDPKHAEKKTVHG